MRRYVRTRIFKLACVYVVVGIPLLSLCWAGTHKVPNDEEIDCKDFPNKHPCVGRSVEDCEGIYETQVNPKPDGTKQGDGTATVVAMSECYRSVPCFWDDEEEGCIPNPLLATEWEPWGTKYIPGPDPPEE